MEPVLGGTRPTSPGPPSRGTGARRDPACYGTYFAGSAFAWNPCSAGPGLLLGGTRPTSRT